MDSAARGNSTTGGGESRLSYKFQRLRERLRQAIVSGELSGKLPGERALAERFDANPKTLSKALTDLAAEGLLDRSIGRGTYVRGHGDAPADGKWLILVDDWTSCPVVPELGKLHPDSTIERSAAHFRPSFMNQFDAVIDMCQSTPASLHRSLAVRGVPSVIVGREPSVCVTPAVVLDIGYAAMRLGRRMLLDGRTTLVAVERNGRSCVGDGLAQACRNYEQKATIIRTSIEQLGAHLTHENLAVICDGADAAAGAKALLSGRQQVALSAIGCAASPPCAGYFVHPQTIAQAIVEIIDAQTRRPRVLWLLGEYTDGPAAAPVALSA